jgi:ArsR family transcriptional regulator
MSEQRSIASLCCSPVLAGPLPDAEALDLAAALKVLADPARLRILGMIRHAEGRRARTMDLATQLGLTQPTVTHHLGALFEAGFLNREREGRQTWYAVVPDSFEAVCQAFSLQDA